MGGANTDATKERNADHLRRRQTMLLPAEVTVQVAGDKGGTEHVLHTGEKAVRGAINEQEYRREVVVIALTTALTIAAP